MVQGQETKSDVKALNEAQKLQGEAWNLTLAYAEPMAVKAVLLLGIPDIMAGAGTGLQMSVAEIAGERSAAEFRALLSSAGFSKMNIVPLPPPALQDIIQAFP